jgi:hypothetical protein
MHDIAAQLVRHHQAGNKVPPLPPCAKNSG